jgi:hypothetical protein
VEGIQLPAALALLLRADLGAGPSGRANASSGTACPSILRRMSRMIRPSRLRVFAQCRQESSCPPDGPCAGVCQRSRTRTLVALTCASGIGEKAAVSRLYRGYARCSQGNSLHNR